MVELWLELHRTLVCQSGSVFPRKLWNRVLLAVWLSYCLVISAAYTGNLVAIFTHPAFYRRIDSLDQFVDSSFR